VRLVETVNEGKFRKQMSVKVNLVRNTSVKIAYGCSCPQTLPGKDNFLMHDTKNLKMGKCTLFHNVSKYDL
jgi:hypothetical protein